MEISGMDAAAAPTSVPVGMDAAGNPDPEVDITIIDRIAWRAVWATAGAATCDYDTAYDACVDAAGAFRPRGPASGRGAAGGPTWRTYLYQRARWRLRDSLRTRGRAVHSDSGGLLRQRAAAVDPLPAEVRAAVMGLPRCCRALVRGVLRGETVTSQGRRLGLSAAESAARWALACGWLRQSAELRGLAGRVPAERVTRRRAASA